MNKRDLVFSVFDPNRKPETIPAAFFLHFDPAFHQGQAAVDKHLEFFRYTGMDFVKIQFELPFPHLTEIREPKDWEKLPFFKLEHYEPMLKVVAGLVKAAKAEAPVIVTLYSPHMLTNDMVGAETVTRHIQEDPAAYQRGISRMTESLLLFVRECIRLGVDGFYASSQGGEYGRLNMPGAFEACIRPYDMAIMNEINGACAFNILHVCDYFQPYDDLTRFKDYPSAVVNTSLELVGQETSAYAVSELFGRPFMGGLERKGVIHTGTPDQIRAAVKDAIAKAPERFMLGADCTIPATTPWANLRLAIQTAHEALSR